MSQPVVTIADLSFRYDDAPAPTLHQINLTVQPGAVVLILGPSGCGKSTLLLSLNGIVPQHLSGQMQGSVTVAGRDVAAYPTHALAEVVAMVFQDPEAQFCTLYVEEEVAFGLENLRYSPAVIRERVQQALQQVGLAAQSNTRLDQLSGGQKQKVALAAALAMHPEILVLDAPTANLDPVSARDFYALLRRLKTEHGQTQIIVEQHIEPFIDMVDQLVLLNEAGQLVANGAPRAVIADLGVAGLEQYGIWTPQMWELAARLHQQGAGPPAYPLTVAEAVTTLAPLLRDYSELPSAAALPEPATPPALVQINQLSYRYVASSGATQALRDVTIDISAGDFCAIVGQNGAGKTTLAKCMARILAPPRGALLLKGADVATIPLAEIVAQIGYVFQNPEHQFVEHTVYDELAYSLRVRGVAEATVRERVEAALARFHLEALAQSRPFTLSRGEQRRLSVATMLVLDPALLILDEPTMGLDRAAASRLMDALRERQAQGTTIVCITHDMRLVAEYARSVVVMSNGTVLFQGGVNDLFAQPAVLEAADLLVPPIVAFAQQTRAANPDLPLVTAVGELQPPVEVA